MRAQPDVRGRGAARRLQVRHARHRPA